MTWPVIKVRRYNDKDRYAVDLRRINQGTRTFLHNRDGLREATELINAVQGKEEQLGNSAWNLTLEQISDATRSFRILKEAGLNLTLEHCVEKHLDTIPKYIGININDARYEYEKYKENNFDRTYEDTTINEAKQKVKRFCITLEEGTVTDQVTSSHVKTFLDNNKYIDNTRRSYYYSIRTFFNYCKKRQWCKTNPTDDLPKPEVILRNIEFIKNVEYVMDILETTKELAPKMLPMLALRLFAGVRTKEASLLEPEDINMETGYVTVGVEKDKNGRRSGGRLVEMESNLKEILLLHPLVPNQKWSNHLWKKIKLCVKLNTGYDIPKNSPRRSYVTYHAAKTNDLALTSKNAGSSIDTLYKHYKGLATQSDGIKYFSYT